MRLTNMMRDAFVHAVMADVPQKDFQEEMIKITKQAADDAMPKILRDALIQNPDVEVWLRKEWITAPDGCPSVEHFKGAARWDDNWLPRVAPEAWEKLKKLGNERKAQETQRYELKSKIRGCANSCSTRKQLANMLPEFEKYLPVDEKKAAQQYPVVANVVADFVKAGWPKSKTGK